MSDISVVDTSQARDFPCGRPLFTKQKFALYARMDHIASMLSAEKPRSLAKMHRLVARVSDEDRGLIAQAAAITGQTVSGFVLAQVRKAAMETFESHARIVLNAAESRRLVEALLAPPRSPTPRMLRAMKLHDATVSSEV